MPSEPAKSVPHPPSDARRHSSLSYEHAGKLEAQLQQEVQELLAMAESADQSERPQGLFVPAEIARREVQLAAIAAAKAKIEARAKARHEREQTEFDAKLKARGKKAAKTGRKPRGKPPAPPSERPREEDQVNLTDDESRIMKVAGGGFEQCFNAQAMVDTETMLAVVSEVTQAASDKQQIEPMLKKLQALPEATTRTGRTALPSRSRLLRTRVRWSA